MRTLRRTLFPVCLIWLAAAGAFLGPVPSEAKGDAVSAMWAWNYETAVSTREQRERLIDFAVQHDINVVFVGTRRTLAGHHSAYAD